MQVEEALAKAIDIAGSKSALAKIAGVKPPTLRQWVLGIRKVPPRRAVIIERKTGVSRRDLCPDFPWEDD